MFLIDDLYTVTGSTKLYHCWTDKVTKFDSSSFYNWEQDNMPVYDLDERTHYLWEQLGFPTSSIPGVMLVVSSTASDNDILCNKNIFRSVSSAVAALPQTINFPVIIEIANFGDLGNLILNNIKFGPRGSLEIINRNFSKADAEISGVVNFNGGANQNFAANLGKVDGDPNNLHSYLSSIYLNPVLASEGNLSQTFSVRGGFIQASALSLSCSIFSSVTDSRLLSNLNGFTTIHRQSSNEFSKGGLIQNTQNNVSPFNSTSSTINFKAYDLNGLASDGIGSCDVSTIDSLAGGYLYLNNMQNDLPVKGLFYGNKLFKIIVNNCEGPIYLRNFYLDGSGASLTDNNYGVEVNNSTNVYLENIVVTRYRKAGLLFNNSNITLLRGCVANRIYNFNSNTRLTGPWSIKSNYITQNSDTQISNVDSAAGLVANNSIITVSSTRQIEETLQKNNVVNRHGEFSNFYPYINNNYIFDFSKNSNGIVLINSILQGGDKYYPNIGTHYKYQINFDVYSNVEYGIKSINSKISFDGRLNIFENLKGILLDSSVFEIDKSTFIFNQKVGLEANNSNIIYNKNLFNYGSFERPFRPLMFSGNGQHIILDNSNMNPVFTSSMDSIYEEIYFNNSIGKLNSTLKQPQPSVEIKNNSKAVLISPFMRRDSSHSVVLNSNTPCKGSELSVTNNSKLNIKGTKNYATRIFGPAGRGYQNNIVGVYAGNKSTIEINGPTVIAQYGIDLLAESNSTISMNPHKSIDNRSIDLSSFNLLDGGNHTAVELHSTRSCIVVDDHSTFDAKDLGSFKTSWKRSNVFNTLSNSGLDYISEIETIDPYVSAGSLQFYPNPIGTYNNALGTFPGIDTVNVLTTPAINFTVNSNPGLHYLKSPSVGTVFDYSAVTAGGYCIRALNNSLINVHNVNFPCGWWQTSAPYYDNTVGINSGGYCSKLFIWNIADNSQLKASYLSVSGLYPRDAGYYGPSGLWASAGSSRAASSMPSSTPDTSTISVLDYFGAAGGINPFGKTTAENYGPFRLYFSVDPVVYSLTEAASSLSGFGYIPQIYSQGYQPVSSLVCNSTVSSIYSVALQRNSSNNIVPSGYYYGSSMMSTGGFIRVFLDESASETFANSKHCSVGKSGNAKLTTIHYPYTTKFGSSNGALGIKSVNLFDIERDN